MKKRLIWVSASIIVLILSLFIFSFIQNHSLSPYDYLRKRYLNKESQIAPVDCITQKQIEPNLHIVFYWNQNGNIIAALIRTSILSKDIVVTSGEIYPYISGQTNWLYSTYQKGEKGLLWGCTKDIDVKDVFVDSERAAILKMDGFTIYYSLGEVNNHGSGGLIDVEFIKLESKT